MHLTTKQTIALLRGAPAILKAKPRKVRVGDAVLYNGDCLKVMADLDVMFHSVVTDPPYHLNSIVERFSSATAKAAKGDGTSKGGVYTRSARGFMGQEWDGGDIAFRIETWKLMMDLLKPGGHLLAFSGSRTYHRMACAIEDAGFDIRDQVMWMYGSGFPKGLDVGKMIDKVLRGVPHGTSDPEGPNKGKWHEKKAVKSAGASGMVKREHDVNGFDKKGLTKVDPRIAKMSPEALEWLGWNIALKPAHEPVVVARAPMDGTVAKNVMAHGTGALNIGACRVGLSEVDHREVGRELNASKRPKGKEIHLGGLHGRDTPVLKGEGRWPANVMHDGSREIIEAFAAFGNSKSGVAVQRNGGGQKIGGEHAYAGSKGFDSRPDVGYADSGTAARFFYEAKTSKRERHFGMDEGKNVHPTVKPVAVMRYLIRLATAERGRVLDPFMGSGTTGMAALIENKRFVGIEQSPEYFAICVKRIEAVMRALDAGENPFKFHPLLDERQQAMVAAGKLGPGLFN